MNAVNSAPAVQCPLFCLTFNLYPFVTFSFQPVQISYVSNLCFLFLSKLQKQFDDKGSVEHYHRLHGLLILTRNVSVRANPTRLRLITNDALKNNVPALLRDGFVCSAKSRRSDLNAQTHGSASVAYDDADKNDGNDDD